MYHCFQNRWHRAVRPSASYHDGLARVGPREGTVQKPLQPVQQREERVQGDKKDEADVCALRSGRNRPTRGKGPEWSHGCDPVFERQFVKLIYWRNAGLYFPTWSSGFDHGHDLGLNSLDDGCIVVAVNPLNSLESTEDHCGSPSPRSDGNTTDDSGIDSISEKIDKLVHEAALKQESERRRSLLAFALGDYPASAEIKSSPAAKAKSVLQETYGSLKRHTTAMDAPWKRDFILSHAGLKKSASRDNLLVEKGGPVELTGMKSKVKETVQALETKFSQVRPFYSPLLFFGWVP